MALPMPVPPPVTMATRPLNSPAASNPRRAAIFPPRTQRAAAAPTRDAPPRPHRGWAPGTAAVCGAPAAREGAGGGGAAPGPRGRSGQVSGCGYPRGGPRHLLVPRVAPGMSGGRTAGESGVGASSSRAEHPGDSWSPVPAASLQQSPPPASVRSALALKSAFYCVVVYRVVLHFYLFVKKVYFSQHCVFFHVISGLLEQESSAAAYIHASPT